MATYAIGDVQGCFGSLLKLLDLLRFDPAGDRLWFVGDLVNRGPDSLETLRFVRDLDDRALTVLGNHDLHLLALAAGKSKQEKRHNLDSVLKAPDRDELLDWLRFRPLMHFDPRKEFALIHAGLPPQWDLLDALSCAEEVEGALRGPDYLDFLQAMYGNEPKSWSGSLSGMDRLRFITNCFTRLRYCDANGTLALKEKAAPDSRAPGMIPWFQVPNRASRGVRIIFGHWSTLGYAAGHNTWALDTGCVWNGRLTAIRVRRKKLIEPISISCS